MAADPIEISHRRRLYWTLSGVAVAAFLATVLYRGPVLRALAQCDAIVRQCFAALFSLSPLELLPLTLLASGAAYATGDFLVQRRRLRRALRAHGRRAPRSGEPVHVLAASHGLGGRVVMLEGAAANPAFAAGFFRPRIYLSAALQDDLSPSELRALFRHEAWHVLRRDPLRFTALRFVARMFFWLPIVRLLADDAVEEAELLADDYAAEEADPLSVAGAVVKVARRAGTAFASVAGARGLRPIERRVRRLLGEKPTPPSVLPRREGFMSVAAALALWAVLAWTPLPIAMIHGGHEVAHCPLCADVAAGGHTLSHDDCHLFHL